MEVQIFSPLNFQGLGNLLSYIINIIKEFFVNTLKKNLKFTVLLLVSLMIILGVPVLGYADITPVSDRTAEVRDAIVAAIPDVNSADDVTETHLAAITSL